MQVKHDMKVKSRCSAVCTVKQAPRDSPRARGPAYTKPQVGARSEQRLGCRTRVGARSEQRLGCRTRVGARSEHLGRWPVASGPDPRSGCQRGSGCSAGLFCSCAGFGLESVSPPLQADGREYVSAGTRRVRMHLRARNKPVGAPGRLAGRNPRGCCSEWSGCWLLVCICWLASAKDL